MVCIARKNIGGRVYLYLHDTKVTYLGPENKFTKQDISRILKEYKMRVYDEDK